MRRECGFTLVQMPIVYWATELLLAEIGLVFPALLGYKSFNLEEPIRVANPTRVNLEEPSGYPAQPGLIWRNRQVTQHNQD